MRRSVVSATDRHLNRHGADAVGRYARTHRSGTATAGR